MIIIIIIIIIIIKPGFQALSEGLIVLLCVEVIRQGVPTANSG